MKKIYIIFSILLISGRLFAQTLDHRKFLQEIENSSDNIYNTCLKKYDEYLDKHPNDVSVLIEKCKFIQYAQYDENEDYNPNQEAFDSCSSALIKMFPEHPEVLIFQTTYLWEDELKIVFKNAETAIEKNPEEWSKTNKGILYIEMADQYYWDSEYQLAYTYIQKAISNDVKYKSSLEYAQILIELDRQQEALDVLLSGKDTTKNTWEISQKAELFLELKSYSNALDLYNLIDEIDSTYNNNSELASTLEGIGEFEYARKCLITDTSQNWDKETTLKNLLIHDLKYQDGAKCIATYNKYRDIGYLMDPLGIYRFKLFLTHPLQAWKFRDILSVLSLMVVLFLLVLIPSIWILPVYFIGHNWKLITNQKSFELYWGLKAFWFVSTGYLISTFISIAVEPEYLYSLINSSYYDLSEEKRGLMSLLFILIMAGFGFASLYKINSKVLLSNNWSISKSIFLSIVILFAYKIITGIYIKIGVVKFGLSIDDFASFPNLVLAFRQDIEAVITTYGKVIGFILLGLFAPFYEEIVFRGVILDSCQRYINFSTANIIQSTFFAAVHQSLFLFPLFFLFGIITGIMRKKSGGLLPGFVFHLVNNILAISLVLIRL